MPAHRRANGHGASARSRPGHARAARATPGTLFGRVSKHASRSAGSPWTFAFALAVVLAWLAVAPFFRFSDSWQLAINTATTIVTFLMVFLIQNTQNRGTEAIQIKLDELIRVTEAASNTLLDLEELDEKTLELHRRRYERLAEIARREQQTPSERIDHDTASGATHHAGTTSMPRQSTTSH